MYTHKNRFSRMLVMLLALVMVVGTFSGCQKNDLQPLVTELELLAEETMEPTEETEPETSLPEETTEPTVFTEPTEAEEETTEPTEAEDKPHAHVYTTTVVAPTTSTQGYTLHTCKICGDSYKDNYKNKLTSGGSSGSSGSSGSTHTHSYTTAVMPASCTKEGYTIHTCKTCGYSYKANEKPALGHTEEKTVTKPTCTEKGYTTCKCTRCGYSYKTDEVPALGHDWKCWSETNYNGWEAYQNGTAEQHHLDRRDCLRCGKAEFQDLGLGHAPGKLIKTVKPTCTEGGYELHECMGFLGNDVGAPQCAETIKTNEVPALGHDWGDWVTTKEPTQNADGSKTRTCTRCPETETQKIDKLPPSKPDPTDPDITDPGTTTPDATTPDPTDPSTQPNESGTGSTESDTETNETVSTPANPEEPGTGTTEHTWGEWVVTQEPTKDSEGVETRTCSKCKETETHNISKLPPETTEPETTEPEIDTSNSVIATNEALEIINKYRAEYGLAPYSAGGGEDFAKLRAAELLIKFDHVHPDGTPAIVWGNPYGFNRECIFAGSYSAQSAVDWWMASKWGHREAMLDPDYTFATIAKNGVNWVFLAG